MDEETPLGQRRQGEEYRYSGLELVVSGLTSGVVHFPLCQERVQLGGADPDVPLEGVCGRLFFHGSQLLFESESDRAAVVLGQVWRLGGYELRVQGEEPRGALLEGLCEPYLGRFWPLGREVFHLGRPGRRLNQLVGSKMSREHARIVAVAEGHMLQVETARSVSEVNGQGLGPGQTVLLRDGDVLQLGDARLRFRLQVTAPARDLRLFTLGAFEVHTLAGPVSQSEWKHRMACYLLARVAVAGGLVPLERVLEDFWPDGDPANARRRLTWHLCALRTQLGEDWVVRTAYGLQLREGVWHDVLELERALRLGDVELVLQLYRGRFLEDCYLDWAEQLRRDLEGRFVACLLASLEGLVDPHLRQAVSQALLLREPDCEAAYVHSMRADLELGMPQRALRTFEMARQKLGSDLGVELMRVRLSF